MQRKIFLFGLIFSTISFLSACGSQAVPKESLQTEATATEQTASSSNVSFSGDIKPILDNRCGQCHSGGQARAGFDVSTHESLMAGSQNGAVIIPGNAENSMLVGLISDGRMPKAGPKLTPEQIQLIIDWINAGAQNN